MTLKKVQDTKFKQSTFEKETVQVMTTTDSLADEDTWFSDY